MAEPETVEVAGQLRLHGTATLRIVGSADSDLADEDGPAYVAQTFQSGPQAPGRQSLSLSLRYLLSLLRVENVHLHTAVIHLYAPVYKIAGNFHITLVRSPVHVTLIGIERNILWKIPHSPAISFIDIVIRHQSAVSLIVELVHHVPVLDAIAVSLCERLDMGLKLALHNLPALRHPCRMPPRTDAIDDGMTFHIDTLLLAEVHNGVGCRTAVLIRTVGIGNISPTCVLTVPYGKRAAYIAAGWTTKVFKGGIVELPAPEGIQAVKVKTDDKGRWYDLEGKETHQPEKGKIYIRKGKKVLVK